MILRRHEHPRLVWVCEHLLMLYIAAAVTVLVILGFWEAIHEG